MDTHGWPGGCHRPKKFEFKKIFPRAMLGPSAPYFFLKEIFLSPGHDQVVKVKSLNFFYCESLVLSGFLY